MICDEIEDNDNNKNKIVISDKISQQRVAHTTDALDILVQDIENRGVTVKKFQHKYGERMPVARARDMSASC